SLLAPWRRAPRRGEGGWYWPLAPGVEGAVQIRSRGGLAAAPTMIYLGDRLASAEARLSIDGKPTSLPLWATRGEGQLPRLPAGRHAIRMEAAARLRVLLG